MTSKCRNLISEEQMDLNVIETWDNNKVTIFIKI